MSDSRRRNVAILCVFLVSALAFAGCGGKSDQNDASAANSLIHLRLEDGGLAKDTPDQFSVSPGALVTVDARTGGGGTYRLSVLAASTAQTFKIPPDSRQTITIAKLDRGDVAKLVSGKRTARIVADASGKP